MGSAPYVLAAGLIYGGVLELIQPHLGRSAQIGDMVANILGLAAGLALGWSLRQFHRRLK